MTEKVLKKAYHLLAQTYFNDCGGGFESFEDVKDAYLKQALVEIEKDSEFADKLKRAGRLHNINTGMSNCV